ncbi:MAG TPA: homoserine dehydrogenase, partial [Sphingobium sp.]
ANKALLAKHGLKLARAAEKHGGALNYEAAVGAAIPVVKTLREGLTGTGINRVYGILNGTCNYILTRMEQEGLSFAECLKDAQRLGYAEANPSFDVDGHDTAQKLAILASLAFGTKVAQSAVYVEGISSIAPEDLRAAEELGYRVKLLGVAVRTAKGIEQRVHPTMVPKSSSIAQVMGVTNAVTIDGEGIPAITLVGPGAGGAATASAVVADIIDVARDEYGPAFAMPAEWLQRQVKADAGQRVGRSYLRLRVQDRPGVLAEITAAMRDAGVSIESLIQRGPEGTEGVLVAIVTHATEQARIDDSFRRMAGSDSLIEAPMVMHILD